LGCGTLRMARTAVRPGCGACLVCRQPAEVECGVWCGGADIFSDNAAARGTKCLGGICLLNDPILFMYR
jgi:hypothetical protein